MLKNYSTSKLVLGEITKYPNYTAINESDDLLQKFKVNGD